MFLDNLLSRGTTPVLEQVLAFTEARHTVLANNVSNFDTVGYKVKDLPEDEFFATLREAVDRRDRRGAGAPLEMKSTRHLNWTAQGHLEVKPVELSNNNVLFHDQNNRFVEKQMVAMAKNTMLHNVTAELLRKSYDSVQTAIRGRL